MLFLPFLTNLALDKKNGIWEITFLECKALNVEDHSIEMGFVGEIGPGNGTAPNKQDVTSCIGADQPTQHIYEVMHLNKLKTAACIENLL